MLKFLPVPQPNFGEHKFVVAAVACIFVAKVDVVVVAVVVVDTKIAAAEIQAPAVRKKIEYKLLPLSLLFTNAC